MAELYNQAKTKSDNLESVFLELTREQTVGVPPAE
jgi:hypothetical protein